MDRRWWGSGVLGACCTFVQGDIWIRGPKNPIPPISTYPQVMHMLSPSISKTETTMVCPPPQAHDKGHTLVGVWPLCYVTLCWCRNARWA